MPEENKIYYAAVLRVHEDVKRELREEEDCSGLQTRAEVRVGSLSSTPATKVVGGESTVNTDVAPVAAPEQLNERELRRLSRERAAQAARGELELAVDAVRLSTVLDDTRDRGVAVEAEVEGPSEQAEKAPLVSPVLAPDFDESPLAVSLLQVVAVAAQVNE
ncbi:unnamed protein product [Symbiodinium microadriaticum]|nr:unnamed protein product [Symbiodinium microadriaticum]